MATFKVKKKRNKAMSAHIPKSLAELMLKLISISDGKITIKGFKVI